jgi:hypothetical protein
MPRNPELTVNPGVAKVIVARMPRTPSTPGAPYPPQYPPDPRDTTRPIRTRRVRLFPSTGVVGGIITAAAAVIVLLLVLSAIHLLPQLRNPFGETTTVSPQPAILKSITQLSRYEAANGEFQVVVDLTKRNGILPGFLAGSETLFVGQGSDIAFVDFSHLKGPDIKVSQDRKTVSITLPKAQLEPAVLNVKQSYVFAQQSGLFTRIGNFFGGNPNSEQQVYILAQQKIQTAAAASALRTDAQNNTKAMLTSMMTSLGFQHVTVAFG